MTAQPLEPILSIAPRLAGREAASQRWADLVFVHWRVDAERVAPLLPAGVHPDTFDGSSWVGLVGFLLEDATVFGSAAIPFLGSFVEVSVRLYGVDEFGRRGVIFRSLEASRLVAVVAARGVFSIPYHWARTGVVRSDIELRYFAKRYLGSSVRSDFTVRPTGQTVKDDALADFLTARWALFTRRFGRTRYLRAAHEPWALDRAELVSIDDTLLAAAGLEGIADRPPDSVLLGGVVTARFGGLA